MAKRIFTRDDIGDLANRLQERALSPLLDDMPSLQQDLRSTVAIFRYLISKGIPPTPIEIENGTPPFAGA